MFGNNLIAAYAVGLVLLFFLIRIFYTPLKFAIKLIGNAIAANTSNGTTDYTIPMLIFALFGALAVVIAVLLKITDKRKGYGLEEANIKQ